MSKNCEFCKRAFGGGEVRKKVRGERYTFCSESCFVMWRYRRPVPDWEKLYAKYTISVAADITDLIDEQSKGGRHEDE